MCERKNGKLSDLSEDKNRKRCNCIWFTISAEWMSGIYLWNRRIIFILTNHRNFNRQHLKIQIKDNERNANRLIHIRFWIDSKKTKLWSFEIYDSNVFLLILLLKDQEITEYFQLQPTLKNTQKNIFSLRGNGFWLGGGLPQ